MIAFCAWIIFPGSTNPPTASLTATCVSGTRRNGNARSTSAPRAWLSNATPARFRSCLGFSTNAGVPHARLPHLRKNSTPDRRSMDGNASMERTFHSVQVSRPSASRGRTMRPTSSDALVKVSPPSSTSTDLPASAMCRATALPIGPLPTTTTSCFARGAASEEARGDMRETPRGRRAGTRRDGGRDRGTDAGRPGRDGLARARDSSRGDIAPTRLALSLAVVGNDIEVGRRPRKTTRDEATVFFTTCRVMTTDERKTRSQPPPKNVTVRDIQTRVTFTRPPPCSSSSASS